LPPGILISFLIKWSNISTQATISRNIRIGCFMIKYYFTNALKMFSFYIRKDLRGRS
jgi:hypothetical protein